jgi:hypothetical protein
MLERHRSEVSLVRIRRNSCLRCCTCSSATIPGMKMLPDDDLEDESPDLRDIPTRDLSRPIRRLAPAVLVQAVLDSRLPIDCYRRGRLITSGFFKEMCKIEQHETRVAEILQGFRIFGL